MDQNLLASQTTSSILIRISQDASGQHVAQAIGLPEVHARAATPEEAIARIREMLGQWISSGRLVSLPLPIVQPMRKPAGWAKDDPLEREFLDDLARRRKEDLERTLREDEQEASGCSNTSSTPTT